MDGLTISNARQFLENSGIRKSDSHDSVIKDAASATGTAETSFADTLQNAIGQVNQAQQVADQKIQELATGRTDDVASVMIATEKADIALRTMMQVRNKIIDAYQEIMRMQV